MMFYSKIILAFLFFSLPVLLRGQSKNLSDGGGSNKDTSHNIIIYGDSFFFSVNKPTGWNSRIVNSKKYKANIIFYKSKEGMQKNLNDSLPGGTLIQILAYKKTDEEVNKDLEQDISAFKEKNHDLKQQNLYAAHKEYACFSKLAYIDNNFYCYFAYINPGIKFRNAFSVTMNISAMPATQEELSAFRSIVSSLVIFKR